ncbi:phage major capsid protein [Schleiferilactobacillus harbinensis]|uniref:Phage major capsid protein n=1 Tax=Schleiferilactobacillus harbinensis TaxID=304207 RepID=A0A5P8M3Z1_9LACO|nr:phage major capsid protein [Schleiferilactobacillus harbinensis]QFR23222.1 phage major capsid protein [Schleiferilactobacillus harbinensis]
MHNINDLNAAWIQAGQNYTDLQNKSQKMAVALAADPSTYTKDQVQKMQDELDAAKTARDFAKSQLDEAKAQAAASKPEPIANKQVTVTKPATAAEDFVHNFVDVATGKVNIRDLVTSGNTDGDTSNAGLTIPPDIQTNINQLKRQYASLEPYVSIENVTTPTGTRVYEPFETLTPLANLDDEDAAIPDNDDPKLYNIKYTIHRYAGISTMPNTLLQDSAENIQAWIEQFVGRKDVVTRNGAILGVMNDAPKKPTIAKFDDILDMIYTAVDPAIVSTSVLMTNVSGFATLAKVKDAMGDYLIQANVVPDMPYSIRGHQVIVISDRWLPDAVDSKGAFVSHPLYYGDLAQAAKLFDRQQMSLVVTNIGAGAFEHDQTKLRVIDRFDVEATDKDAFVAGSFAAVADQQANFAAGSTSASK